MTLNASFPPCPKVLLFKILGPILLGNPFDSICKLIQNKLDPSALQSCVATLSAFAICVRLPSTISLPR